ncbi:MAG: sigma-70 family RNA polymerase sigma factor [Planctomycetes bacterium]|nr:sigma-70 family RNA polymerase sigma factor [Planctomycetota bacterium]
MIRPFGSPDRLLRHFCRTGDPRALGKLFDRTAPELLRAALWLCRDRTDAEDLLQRTFLTVIEARANFDLSRPAMPWLVGILGNHARKLQEQRRRDQERRTVILEGPRILEGPGAVADPAHEAAGTEFVAMLTEMRRSIGAPYSEVLDLHLGQGLMPAEIAAALGRPQGTVRTQLMRGLALLRQRLPMHIIAPLGAFALLSQGASAAQLAPLRASLLKAAGITTRAASATFASKSLLTLAAALLACFGTLWWTWLPAAADPLLPQLRSAHLTGLQGETRTETTPDLPGVDQRAYVAAEVRSGDGLALPTGLVRGQVVDSEGHAMPAAQLWLSQVRDWTRGAEVAVADAEGRFELQFSGPRFLGAVAPGHVVSFLHALDEGRQQEVTLRLRGESARVTGCIYGADGAPLAAAVVEVGLQGGWIASNTTSERRIYPPRRLVTTDARGDFHLDGIEPGQAVVLVHAAHHGSYRGEVLAERGRDSHLAIRLQRGARVAGTVRDSARQPLVGATIKLEGGDSRPLSATSDDLGQFVLTDLAAGPQRLLAELGASVATVAFDLAPGQQVAWDPILEPAQTLRGVVLDPAGKPLPGVQVQLGDQTTVAAKPAAETTAEGAFSLSLPSQGPLDLLFLHLGTPLAVRRALLPNREPLTITLTAAELPSARVTGRMVDREGRAIRALLTVRNHAFHLDGKARADGATGTFQLDSLPSGSYTLVLEAPGFGRTPIRVLELQPDETRDLGPIVLDAAGRAEVTLVGDASQHRRVVKFVREDGTVVAHSMTEGAAVTAELPPGRYTASVLLYECAGSATPVLVRSGETTRCDLLCAPTATMTLRVTGLSAPRDGGRVDVVIRDAGGNFLDAYELTVGNQPAMHSTFGLPPGSYRIEARSAGGRAATKALVVKSPQERLALTLELQ